MIRSKNTAAVLVLGSWLVSACAISNPMPAADEHPVSDITVEQARDDERLEMSAEDTVSESAQSTATVRWGGTIAGVHNRADNTTVVEIVSRPLYTGGRPIHDDRSDGRFLAEVGEFLDPQIVEVGRDMTVLGELVERRSGKIGEADYVFPVVTVQEYKYWKEVVVVPTSHFSHWNKYPPYGRYDPLWRDWPFSTDRRPSGLPRR